MEAASQANERPGAHRFMFLGSRLCLDFTNTVSGMRMVRPVERLLDYRDLVSWGLQVGMLSQAQARALVSMAKRDPLAAEQVRARGIALREALFRCFHAHLKGDELPPADLERVNQELSRALCHRRIVGAGRGVGFGWEETRALDSVLWPVVDDAATLLAGGSLGRVRICEATATDGCGWLFFDTTKSGTRRWCSMKECGNRAKARRFYAKARDDDAG